MKKLFLSMVLLLAGLLSALADGKEHPITVQELPREAQDFLSTYFKDKTVAYVVADRKYTGDEYEVIFTDRTQIDFRKDGQWESIECKNTPVPAEIIPRQIREFVEQGNFPGQYVRELKRNAYTWEIELSTGREVKFDKQFKVIGYDKYRKNSTAQPGQKERNITVRELPKTAQEFLATHFKDKKPAYIIADRKHAGTEYEVVFADRTEVDFRPDGQWESVESKYSPVPESVVPRQIQKFVKEGNFTGQFIREIQRNAYTWEIQLSGGLEVKFDTQFNVIGYDD